MSRSTPAPPPEPERRAGNPEPLVDALGGHMTHRHDNPSRPAGSASVDEPGHHRGPRRHPSLRLAAIAVVLVLVLVVVVLIL
jgi:hypothetical protein